MLEQVNEERDHFKKLNKVQSRAISNYTQWLQEWRDQNDNLEAEIRRLKGEPDPHAGFDAYGESIGDSD